MLLISKTTPTFWLSPPLQIYRENSLTYPNDFVSFRPSSRNPFVSSTLFRSSVTIGTAASILINETADRKITDYNVEICRFCEMGDLRSAMELINQSPKPDMEMRTYCAVLQLCADLTSIRDGRRIHTIIQSNDVEVDGVLGSKLVFMYVTCGDLKEGRRIFDQVANEKIFLWNLLMSEYAKVGNFRESLSLFKRMRELEVKMNSYTFSCIMKCYAALGSVEEGEGVHGYLLRLGFGSHNTVVNSLIAFYSKCRRVESARKLFDELGDRDIISWNSMISGYVANGLPDKGLELFKQMLLLGINADLATMVSVVVGCSNTGMPLLGRTLHAYAIKASMGRELTLNNSLLDMYSKSGDLNGATQVFETMDERSVVSWTSMMAAYARGGLSDRSIRLFHEMEKESISPDLFTITTILHACACTGLLENGKVVHNYIKEKKMRSDLFVSNALMDMYAKCGSMEDAHLVFLEMLVRDIVSWNTMIGGYSKNSLANEALNLFVEMQHNSKPNGITMACILPACASLAALEKGREIHGHILRNGFSVDRHVANALVDMYVKCGALGLARLLFDMIPEKDLVSWTVMIAGYGMHGCGHEAIAAFNEMRNSGIEPDEVSFVSILYACSHSGLLDEGWEFFNMMRNECRIEPNLEHHACIVDLLSRTGNLYKAYRFIEMMPIEPDATIWGALLCGCRIYHDVKLAEKVAEHVFELEPENTGYYVLLANIYAEAEKWEEVKKMRERIGRRGLRKNPGCSWIEIKGKVHIFVSGDSSHPLADKMKLLLKKMRARMKEEGHFPKMRYALIKADDMGKEMALCGHSEKLAMAFGILSLPPSKTVRVTKNLRVCGDCHEMAKFMSKMMKRDIILRDSNRFHHFKNGSCSCRGHW